jgi:hypothetical protein
MRARPFAYNPGATISGTSQVGNIAIGVSPDLAYNQGVGGVTWINGPDEDLGFIIARTLDDRMRFWRSGTTEASFVTTVNTIFKTSFSTGASASDWLNTNGYWTSYTNDSFTNPSLTIGSAVSVQSVSPFSGGGNSYQFSSSTNSYITTPGSSDWAVGTGDFTVEWFSYQTTLLQFQRAFTVGDYPFIKIGVSIESGTFYYWANSSFRYSSSSASTTNTWIHWAVVRRSGVTRVYKNGTQLGSQINDANNITDTTTTFVVGNTNTFATNAALVGYLTNFRWIKGLGIYTGNFTVPTSALTAVASANPYGGSNTLAVTSGYTKLLLVP